MGCQATALRRGVAAQLSELMQVAQEAEGSGFRVQGLGFGVQGSGFRVQVYEAEG